MDGVSSVLAMVLVDAAMMSWLYLRLMIEEAGLLRIAKSVLRTPKIFLFCCVVLIDERLRNFVFVFRNDSGSRGESETLKEIWVPKFVLY